MAAAIVAMKPTTTVQALAESSAGLTSIPVSYNSIAHLNESLTPASKFDESVPVIDFSLLTSSNPDQRSNAVRDLGKACQEWGFFLLVNHGVPESLMKGVLDASDDFFNLSLEEKQEYAGKGYWEPIRFGTGIDVKLQKVLLWRDFLKLYVHPEFHAPSKPNDFSGVAREYCKRTREVVLELLKGISVSLGLEECYIEKAMNFESGFQIFAANLYPPCPQPELAMGIPAHTDHGLITLLINNGVGGLQIQHNGKWFSADAPPNSFLVNTADQLEILSNGKYKSIMHRAVVNSKAKRISLAMAHGPSLDTVISPSQELLEREGGCPPAFMPMKYKEYMELQQLSRLDGSRCVDQLRLQSS